MNETTNEVMVAPIHMCRKIYGAQPIVSDIAPPRDTRKNIFILCTELWKSAPKTPIITPRIAEIRTLIRRPCWGDFVGEKEMCGQSLLQRIFRL